MLSCCLGLPHSQVQSVETHSRLLLSFGLVHQLVPLGLASSFWPSKPMGSVNTVGQVLFKYLGILGGQYCSLSPEEG